MTEITELSGAQKAAVVLMNLDPEAAAGVLRQLSDQEAEEITAEIVRMRSVDADTAETALIDFADLAYSGRSSARGGSDVADQLLRATYGDERAEGLMNRVANSMAGRSFEFLDESEPTHVGSLLEAEMPQTIALVLAHLKPAHASAVLSGFRDPLRTQVAQAIATMSSATPDTIALIAQHLRARAVAVVGPRSITEVVGGIQPLVDIINRSSVETEKAVLAGLEERDPELAEQVRARLLTFADIVKFEDRDVQQVLRAIELSTLAVAMKGSSEAVQAKIRENLSENKRGLLDEEIAVLGRTRQSQVEEARADIVRGIRELEQSGQITIVRGDGDDFVE